METTILSPLGSERAAAAAERLIGGFGSLAAALAAPRRRLLRVTNHDTAAVRLVCAFRTTMMHALRTRLVDGLMNIQDVVDYLAIDAMASPVERINVLFFDRRSRLVGNDLLGIGTSNSVIVPIQEILRRALDLGAACLVLAHNHPGGDPAPSPADFEMTRRLARAAGAMEILLYDHLIISASGFTSFRSMGLL